MPLNSSPKGNSSSSITSSSMSLKSSLGGKSSSSLTLALKSPLGGMFPSSSASLVSLNSPLGENIDYHHRYL
jgi:hypothetical protein